MFTEQLPDLLDYINNLPGFACLVGDMNINYNHKPNKLRCLLTTPSLHNLVQVINKPTRKCGHIIDWVVVRPDDDIHKNLLLQTHLNQTIIALNPNSIFQSLSGLLGT